MLRQSIFIALFTLSSIPASADVSTNPQTAPKGTYKLESNHTSVLFCIKHMGISDYCGRFNTISGKIEFSGSQPAKSSATIEIDMASIDTPSDKLDEKLRVDFLETAKFPKAFFVANSIKITGKNQGEITGALTLHGVTKPMTLTTTFNGGQVHPLANAYVIGFSAMTTIKHADFAFPDVLWKPFIGDDIKLYIESEFIAEK
jgi:polyisoprenoid-binding protein YceI